MPGLGPGLWCSVPLAQADEDEGRTLSNYGARLVPTLVGRQGEMGQKQQEKLVEPLVVLYCRLISLGAFPPWLTRGNVTVHVVPWPGALWTSMVPWWATTISRTT